MEKMVLKDKKIAVYLRCNGYRFTGQCLSEDGFFIVLEDNRTHHTRAFSKKDISGYEVLDE